jgi:hypothetical protein
MKKINFLPIILLVPCFALAQTTENREPASKEPLWDPPKAACDTYKADKESEKSGVSDKEETVGRDLIMPILCNPPQVEKKEDNKEESNSTERPQF